ncbi:MAG: glycosyltransferase family 2 protein [Gammaproteobacteria bacterium]
MNNAPSRARRRALAAALLALAGSVAAVPVLAAATAAPDRVVRAILAAYYAVVAVIVVYTIRHMVFTLNRLFGRQRHPYVDIDTADWPTVTVLVPAHDEEAVIGNCLEALLDVDYPPGRMVIMPIDDRSTDGTRAIIERHAAAEPDRLRPVFRVDGPPGKAAAIQSVTDRLESELVIVFDADYVPGRGLIKQLAAPFFDPEVGAVMGRVVPENTASNLLTRLLDLERAGGYQVDQQARMNLGLVPQYGGSVGGTRSDLLRQLGGWRMDALAEDTDLTYRLLLAGYKVIYQNRCECYEEVPEDWRERNRQIMRWAKGHNQVAWRHLGGVLRNPHLGALERLDAVLLLFVYLIAPLLLAGWACALSLYLLGASVPGSTTVVLLLAAFAGLGNFAAFFEMAAAVHLDGSGARVRLLPLGFFSFLASFVNIIRAAASLAIGDALLGRDLHWAKTARYRRNGDADSGEVPQ